MPKTNTHIVTKLKKSNCEKIKWLQNSKIQFVTKLKKSNCEEEKTRKPNCYKTQKPNLGENVLSAVFLDP